jgi:hypothetical protein
MSSAPLLGTSVGGKGGEATARSPPAWLRRAIDTEEAWAQLQFAVPMVLTNMFYYAVPLVSVMFSGHLGVVHLAGATLGNSWATVTGYAFVVRILLIPHALCQILLDRAIITHLAIVIAAASRHDRRCSYHSSHVPVVCISSCPCTIIDRPLC